MRTSALPESHCPFCGHFLDRVTSSPTTPDATPEPGDITVCINCAGVLVFDENLKTRPPTDAELAEALSYADVRRLIKAIGDVKGIART